MSFTLWLTGRPRAGKTTLGQMLTAELAYRLPQVRHLNSNDLCVSQLVIKNFTVVERQKANLQLAWIARLLNEHGVACIVEQITSCNFIREEISSILPNYKEFFLDCSLEIAMNRDITGCYNALILSGEEEDSFEAQNIYRGLQHPHLIIPTGYQAPAESLKAALLWLEAARLIPYRVFSISPESPYTSEEQSIIEKRLEDLGYL